MVSIEGFWWPSAEYPALVSLKTRNLLSDFSADGTLQGKTTIAAKVVDAINQQETTSTSQTAMLLSMDGYHLTRAELDQMSDPPLAHARRGAAFTFDAPRFLRVVQQLREPLNTGTKTILAPSFDHATKDPVLDDIQILPSCRIVIIEGLYLSLGSGAPEWKQAAEMMDELWFVEVSEDVARERLIRRHVAAGIAQTADEAAKRADENDLVNAREIVAGMLPVHATVQGA